MNLLDKLLSYGSTQFYRAPFGDGPFTQFSLNDREEKKIRREVGAGSDVHIGEVLEAAGLDLGSDPVKEKDGFRVVVSNSQVPAMIGMLTNKFNLLDQTKV